MLSNDTRAVGFVSSKLSAVVVHRSGGAELDCGSDVGTVDGVWDQFLRTALHTISISLQNSF